MRIHASLSVSPKMRRAITGAVLAGLPYIVPPQHVYAQRALGLDVSDWQGSLSLSNWQTIHAPTAAGGGGRDFAFIRSSRGGTTGFYDEHDSGNANGLNNLSQRYDDLYFTQNMDRATSAGMFAGPYHFGRADIVSTTSFSGGIANTGTDEANHMLEQAGAYIRPGYLLPVFDLEAGANRTADQLAQFVNDFGQRIFNAKGVWPIVYASSSYASDPATSGNNTGEIRPSVALNMPNLWIARWPNQANPGSIDAQNIDPPAASGYPNVYGVWNTSYPTIPNPQPWKFWQYASTGTVPISSTSNLNVDWDVAHGDIEFVKDYLVPALWTNDASGSWTTLSNWNSGTADPSGHGGAARLPGANDTVMLDRPAADVLVTLGAGSGSQNIRRLFTKERLTISGGTLNVSRAAQIDNTVILNSGRFTAGSLTINNTAGGGFNQFGGVTTINGPVSGNGTLNVTAGSFTAQSVRGNTVFVSGTGSVTIASGGGSIGTSKVPLLSLSSSGRFDVTNHDLVLDYATTSPINTVRGYLSVSYNGGAWTGVGLTSSAAAASVGSAHRTALGYAEATDLFGAFPATFSGQSVDNTSVLIRYTAAGDANLDGTVDLSDFTFLAAYFKGTGRRGFDGDFK
jgi:GH25 family lysozyme M1 (1,4-beta-N-acetylmuramidase)